MLLVLVAFMEFIHINEVVMWFIIIIIIIIIFTTIIVIIITVIFTIIIIIIIIYYFFFKWEKTPGFSFPKCLRTSTDYDNKGSNKVSEQRISCIKQSYVNCCKIVIYH